MSLRAPGPEHTILFTIFGTSTVLPAKSTTFLVVLASELLLLSHTINREEIKIALIAINKIFFNPFFLSIAASFFIFYKILNVFYSL